TWKPLFEASLAQCELAVQRKTRLLIGIARFDVRSFGPDADARFAFWAHQAGGLAVHISDLRKREKALFLARVEECDVRLQAIAPDQLPNAWGKLLTSLGVSRGPGGSSPERPKLHLTVGEADGLVTYDRAAGELFVRTPFPLPIGDRVRAMLSVPGEADAFEVEAQVPLTRDLGKKSAEPLGFRLKLQAPPPEFVSALERSRRKTPKTSPAPSSTPPTPVVAKVEEPPTPVRVRYETAQSLRDEYLEHLSMGGAFIRTSKPLPVDRRVIFEMELPDGRVLATPGRVVWTTESGTGIEFELDAATDAALGEVIAQVIRRPRRALVVDDDALLRQMLSDTLAARGFEVLTAATGAEGLRILLNELLQLDVLVTDLWMPELDGEALVRTVRQAGGEQDLAIVIVSARVLPAAGGWASSLSIDATLDKVVGPEAIATAVEEAVERRREATGRRRLARPAAVEQHPAPTQPAVLRKRYEKAEALARDAQALALGGVFVRGPSALPLQTEVALELALPNGSVLKGSGRVVSVEAAGVGVEFTLSPEEREALVAALDSALNLFAGTPPPIERTIRELLENEPSPRAPTAVRLGHYELLSRLGRGGMAEVFFARATSGPRAGQTVAIKRLLPQVAKDPECVELFAGEADLTMQLHHPNIVKTLEVGLVDESYFLVMEAVDGRDLGQILRRCKQLGIQLPIDFAVYLAKVLFDALDYAHNAKGLKGERLGIVHCDVSPSNMFISRMGEVKLGDFGVARARGLPGASTVVGKPYYLSPEVIEGDSSVAGDLWAACVSLYELLTLERPFQGETPEEVFSAIRARRYVPVTQRRPEVPAALGKIIERGFAKKP
ncbi:MAG: protein kinase domain-containing protein, partial [Myxococcota bacterium]